MPWSASARRNASPAIGVRVFGSARCAVGCAMASNPLGYGDFDHSANFREKRPWIHRLGWSMASPPGGRNPFAEANEFSSRRGTLKVENVKPPKAPADAGSLHKKMMQLLSSLWVTHAIGTFARLGLADAMEAGADNAEAIAKPRGLVTDRVYRLLRALSTCGIVIESAGRRLPRTPPRPQPTPE